jgi:hypothetical protein
MRRAVLRGQKRIPRVFKTGEKTDIYGAQLFAIAKAGKTSVTYQELAMILEREFADAIPGQQIAAALGHMATFAVENRGTGDAAVAYKNDELHVLDPFLLFYLIFGTWSVDKEVLGEPRAGPVGSHYVGDPVELQMCFFAVSPSRRAATSSARQAQRRDCERWCPRPGACLRVRR